MNGRVMSHREIEEASDRGLSARDIKILTTYTYLVGSVGKY